MANIVSTQVNIGTNNLSYYSSIVIKQQIFGHDSFTLTLPSEYIEGKDGFLFQKSKDLIGKDFTVQSSILGLTKQGKGLQFTGIITSVRRSRANGYSGDLILSGYAPTILLDSGPHCKSWTDATLKTIISDVLDHFPANKINGKINPRFTEKIPYVVQYMETAWQFISRLCATYGEWLYFKTDSLVVGASDGGNPDELFFGSDLSAFDLNMELSPVNRSVQTYDYANTEVYNSSPKSINEKAGFDELGSQVWKVSQALYATTPNAWENRPFDAQGYLDDATNIRSAMTGSSLVKFEGHGSSPGIRVGDKVHVNGSNIYSFSMEDYGSYIPIVIEHQLRMNNKYSNVFTAVPSTLMVPPIAAPQIRRCETQSAVVIANNDPQGIGRIQVKFHWMKDAQITPWIRVTTPHAGGSKGMFFLPEVGEEVMVGFEGDDATKPYVIGAVYNSLANNSYANEGNDVKALQTRSGNKMIYNDKDGSITAEDACGNIIVMDGKGNITITASSNNVSITAPETMTLNAKNLNINVVENMNTNVGQDMSTLVSQNNSLIIQEQHSFSSKNYSQNVGEKKDIYIGGDFTETTGTTTHKALLGDILMQSAGVSTILGAKDAKVNKG